MSCSFIEGVCSFRFPSPEFDPIGWKSGYENGSIIGSVLLVLSMPREFKISSGRMSPENWWANAVDALSRRAGLPVLSKGVFQMQGG